MKKLFLLGLLVTSLGTFVASTTRSASAYYCPPYTRYCQTAAQCKGYCGPGVPASWEICQNGCCACLG